MDVDQNDFISSKEVQKSPNENHARRQSYAQNKTVNLQKNFFLVFFTTNKFFLLFRHKKMLQEKKLKGVEEEKDQILSNRGNVERGVGVRVWWV